MAETGKSALRRLLLDNYEELARRLARRVGSFDLATDALHDAFLRIEASNIVGDIRNPKAYLLSMATNIVRDRRRADTRWISASEGDAYLDAMDEAPRPDQVAERRSDFDALGRALAELPPRRQEIFKAVVIEGQATHVVAARHGVTTRLVQIELKRAIAHCVKHLKESADSEFVISPAESSSG